MSLSRQWVLKKIPKLPKPIQGGVSTFLGLGTTAGATTAGGMVGGAGGFTIGGSITGFGGGSGMIGGIVMVASVVVGASLKAQAQSNDHQDPKMDKYIEYVGKWIDYASNEVKNRGGKLDGIKMIKTFSEWRKNPGI